MAILVHAVWWVAGVNQGLSGMDAFENAINILLDIVLELAPRLLRLIVLH